MANAAGSILGNPVHGLEDPALLTGSGKYVDDLATVNAAHVMFVRSTVAYGTVQSVDVTEAESMPGVIAVYHAGNSLGFTPFQSFPMVAETFNRPVFAGDTVRFVGDIVAAVVAETRAQAVDAIEAVVVDIDPLQAIVDGPDALAAGAPILFPEAGANVCF